MVAASTTIPLDNPTIISPPKKPKFLRRLRDFFHNLGSNHHHHHHNGNVNNQIQSQSMKLELENLMQVPNLTELDAPSHLTSAAIVPEGGPKSSGNHSRHGSRFLLRIFSRWSHIKSHHDEELHSPQNGHYNQPHDNNNYLFQLWRRGTTKSEDELIVAEHDLELVQKFLPSVKQAKELCFHRKYRFSSEIEIIGKGASGVVRIGHRIEDHQGQNPLAIKEFRRKRKSETMEDYIGKLTREFGIAVRLHHVNVVRTIDMVQDGHRWYLVMEQCAQGDLFNFIQKGGLRDSLEIDSCFRQLIEGIHYLHQQGVVHRDLKPENLLIDHTGRLRITDFGVSDILNLDDVVDGIKVKQSKGVRGSSPYIAPEAYGNDSYDGRQVDVWSAGIIYYAMVFHGIPWESATIKDANYNYYLTRGASQFEPFSRLPHGSRCLLRRMLDPDPEKRITLDDILQDDWFKGIRLIPLFHHSPDDDGENYQTINNHHSGDDDNNNNNNNTTTTTTNDD